MVLFCPYWYLSFIIQMIFFKRKPYNKMKTRKSSESEEVISSNNFQIVWECFQVRIWSCHLFLLRNEKRERNRLFELKRFLTKWKILFFRPRKVWLPLHRMRWGLSLQKFCTSVVSWKWTESNEVAGQHCPRVQEQFYRHIIMFWDLQRHFERL